MKSNDALWLLHQSLAPQKLSEINSGSQPLAFTKCPSRDSILYTQNANVRSLQQIFSKSENATAYLILLVKQDSDICCLLILYITFIISHLKLFPGLHTQLLPSMLLEADGIPYKIYERTSDNTNLTSSQIYLHNYIFWKCRNKSEVLECLKIVKGTDNVQCEDLEGGKKSMILVHVSWFKIH